MYISARIHDDNEIPTAMPIFIEFSYASVILKISGLKAVILILPFVYYIIPNVQRLLEV